MQTYSVPVNSPHPSVGDVVNKEDTFHVDRPISAFRVVGQGQVSDDGTQIHYPVSLLRFASYGDYPRMEDGGCALCSGCGCQDCGFTGGY